MAYHSKILTSLFGRRVGLQRLSTAESGAAAARTPEFLVGAEDIRKEVITNDSTGTNLRAWGVSLLSSGLSALTTAVFGLDPPIPGVKKTLVWGSTTGGTMGSKIWATVQGGAGIQTSNGSSFTCVASSAGAVLELMGVTTALYAAVNGSTGSGFSFSTTT